MFAIDDFLIGFAASIVAGNMPTINSMLSRNSTLRKRIEQCYCKAMSRWCPNEDIRRKEFEKYNSFDSLKNYLAQSGVQIDSGLAKLLELWADEIRNDTDCYNAILEIKEDIISAKIDEHFQQLMSAISKHQKERKSFYDASICLKNIRTTVGERYHIDRAETEFLYSWLKKPVDISKKENIILLVGGPGEGKSVIMHDLLIKLQSENAKVLGIKSDLLFDSSDTDLDKKLNLGLTTVSAISEASNDSQVVLLIDQIDALSSTLSSNRKPLAVLNTLISEVAGLNNVRIVVSCRPYDLDYDSSLEPFRYCRRIIVGHLDHEQLSDALSSKDIDINKLSSALQSLLSTTQNLFLYLQLNNKSVDITSQNLLYKALWSEVVDNVPDSVGKVESIIDYLTLLSNKLYERQTLTINESLLGTRWNKIQLYLITQGFLYKDESSCNIQFVHQTLYDYVYARLFTESEKTIESVFENEHQGLFVRPKLRQVLEYQRGIDAETYMRNVKRILFEKNSESKYVYRYQLRHLVLTNMAYQETLLEEEKQFIQKKILETDCYKRLFILSAQSKDSYVLIIKHINENEGFYKQSSEIQYDIIDMISRICLQFPETLEYLCSLCSSKMDENIKRRVSNIVNYAGINICDTNLEKLSDFIEKDSIDIDTYEYYERLCAHNPQKVRKRLNEVVSYVVNNKDKINTLDINIPYQAKSVFDCLKHQNKPHFRLLCLELIDILSSVSCGIDNEDICTSRYFYLYNRNNRALHFAQEVLNDFLNEEESNEITTTERDKIVNEAFAKSIDVYHIIGIVGCMADIERYKDAAYDYLKNNIEKTHNSSPLYYYQKSLFEKVFMLLSLDQQMELLAVVEKLNPEWEHTPLKGTVFENGPISRIGYTRAQYYSLIPYDYLKNHFHKEQSFLDEFQRKFTDLSNREPNAISSMSGWTAMEASTYQKMGREEILKSMEAYNSDLNLDWSIPSRTGHAFALKEQAKDNPDFYFDIYSEAAQNPNIDLSYVNHGIEGLIEINHPKEKIDALIEQTIRRLNTDSINDNDKGEIIQIIRHSSYYINNQYNIPEFFFSFVCNVALNAEDERDDGRNVGINDGINQVRGCACEVLVKCEYDGGHIADIFSVLDQIADTKPSAATRCAMLFQMGLLLNRDRTKVFDLVHQLTSDFNDDVMRLPLHNLNPLLYLNSEEFATFIPYFEASIEKPLTHEVNTALLLRAYLKGMDESERLLLAIADSSETARCTVVRDIHKYYNQLYQEKCEFILLKYSTYEESELGRFYDDIFSLMKYQGANSKEFIDKLIVSPVCKYCNDEIYKFLVFVSETNPQQCLVWLKLLYDQKKHFTDYNLSIDKIVSILVSAYNAIRKFDKGDSVLEDAMDLLDEILMRNVRYWNSFNCLKNLDTWKS